MDRSGCDPAPDREDPGTLPKRLHGVPGHAQNGKTRNKTQRTQRSRRTDKMRRPGGGLAKNPAVSQRFLELQRERDVLRGDAQLAMKRGIGWAAAERLFC